MKRKATEWVDPLIHMSDSVYISQEKQSYHIKFKRYDSYTKISEINARMQKKTAEWVDLHALHHVPDNFLSVIYLSPGPAGVPPRSPTESVGWVGCRLQTPV